jgi:hypothetical protein
VIDPADPVGAADQGLHRSSITGLARLARARDDGGVGTARLGMFLLALGLLLTRGSLVLHEVLGHALFAALFGAQVEEIRLFFFAGGYVSWSGARFSALEQMIVSIGGIGLELVLGTAWVIGGLRATGRGWLAWAVVVAGGLNVLHGLFYLSVGVADGFGDGRYLHLALGPRRTLLAWPAALLLIGGGGLFARFVAAELAGWVKARRPALALLGALAIAAGGHFGLMQLELALRRDTFFAERRAEAADRRAILAMEAKKAEAEARGEVVDPAAEARWAAELRADPPLAFQWFVVPPLIAAVIVGLMWGARRPQQARAPPSPRAQRHIWVVLAVVVASFGLSWL